MEDKSKISAPPKERLLIKVVLPKQGAERAVVAGGGPAKPFRTVDPAFRRSIVTRLHAIATSIKADSVKGYAPVRVKILKEASAKSHRPEFLFSDQTCPIIGAGRLGELFIKGSDAGIHQIERIINTAKADRVIKEISTVETIEPITPEFRKMGLSAAEILARSPKTKNGYLVKVQLFDFGDDDQNKLAAEFAEKCRRAEILVDHAGYDERNYYFAATCKTPAHVDSLAKIVGVRSVRQMPVLRTIKIQAGKPQPFPTDLAEPTDRPGGYPVVVVIDTGVSDKIPALQKWVAGTRSSVAPAYENKSHGTFVAGLLCWGNQLNPGLAGIDGEPCKIFDLHVMPNSDPGAGATDDLTESQLLQDIEAALKAHSNDFKVWNLSMGTSEVCSLDEFSSFAVELDRLQEKYDVSFVISAGNYDSLPLLGYPRQGGELAAGRITTPADSLLGITVGSVAHISHKKNGPREGEPSAFSRHGAGPNHIIKPDLVHYGGTCTQDGIERVGVQSVSEGGLVQDMGTSFSAPLVSRTLANIYHQITPAPSPVLARAILTHHARHPITGGRVANQEENFLGFGIPGPIATSLECPSWASTLVFEDSLRPGFYQEWNDFPYPDSLQRNGRYFGDIWMTVAFAPARGNRWGTEYCETHIDAHFGVYRMAKSKKDGKMAPTFKGLVPPEHKNPGLLYEAYQVERLRKWAPVRTYFGSLGAKGEPGDRWRLKVQLLCRHAAKDRLSANPQKFALIVTIADPAKKAPIYNEMAQKIRNRWQVQNLALRSSIKIQQ